MDNVPPVTETTTVLQPQSAEHPLAQTESAEQMYHITTESMKLAPVAEKTPRGTDHPLSMQFATENPRTKACTEHPLSPAPTNENKNSLSMDLEYESCMKQQLLRHAVEQEVERFMEEPSCVPNLLYLEHIFTQMKNFPLLSSHEKAKEKLDEFILTLPQFLSVSQRASKLDQQNKQLRVLVAGTFHINFKTPLEYAEARKMFEEGYTRKITKKDKDGASPAAEPEQPEDRLRRANFDKGQQELVVVAERMFLDMSQEGGVARFFDVVRATPKLSDLPPIYQDFLRKVGKMMALNSEKNYSDKDQVSKLKRMYRITPMQAIKGILAITNPVKLLAGLLNLFLARPVGMQSLLQNMVSASTELKRSEKLLKNAKQQACTLLKRLGPKVPQKVFDQIIKYIQSHDLPTPEEEHYIKNDKGFKEVSYESLFNVEFVLGVVENEVDVRLLQRPEIDAIQQVIIHEIRVQEKRNLVNMLGTPKIVSMIKELWTIFDEPIALLCRANLGTHLEQLLKGVKDIVKVSEDSKQLSIEERLEAYNVVLQRVQDDFYALCHSIAKKDTGAFQNTFQWYINICKYTHAGEPLDVQSLIRNLSEDDQAKLQTELDALVEFQNLVLQGEKPMRRPLDPTLRKLVPAFNEMVRSRLPHKASTVPKKASDSGVKASS